MPKAGTVDKCKEAELVRQSVRGDKEAYHSLVEMHQDRVFALAYEVLRNKEDAEDVAQESFVKAYLSLKDFKGEASFYTWLYRIVYNMAIDLKRKTKVRGGSAAELDESAEGDEDFLRSKVAGPHEAALRREELLQLCSALDKISEEHRAVVILREVHGLSYAQIAKVSGVSSGTVMSRLHYARKRLQELLKGYVRGFERSSSEAIAGGKKGQTGEDFSESIPARKTGKGIAKDRIRPGAVSSVERNVRCV